MSGCRPLDASFLYFEKQHQRMHVGCVVLLDVMSGGRVDFGIGRGYQPHEFRGYGVDQMRSRGIFNEAISCSGT